jgi:diaminopimelate decarboxylase
LISGNAGILVSEVIFIKEGSTRTFAIVDAAMNDLVRPSMYDAYHAIIPVAEPAAGTDLLTYDVVGPVCETGDTFAKDRALPPLAAGDLIAFRTAGAYGAVMASQYNARPLIPEVLVDGDRYAVIRRRPSFDEMLALEEMPDWLA